MISTRGIAPILGGERLSRSILRWLAAVQLRGHSAAQRTPANRTRWPAFPPPSDCKINANSPAVASYELLTECTENTSPSWNEAHRDWDVNDPLGLRPAKMDGFGAAAHDARSSAGLL